MLFPPSSSENQRLWTTTRTQYFLDTAGQLHIWTTGTLRKTCANSGQAKCSLEEIRGHKIPPTPRGAWQLIAAAVTSQQNLKIVQKDIPVSKSHYHTVEAMDHEEMRISPGISCSHPEGELVSQKESSHGSNNLSDDLSE